MNKAQFMSVAKPLKVEIEGMPQLTTVMEFSSGNLGWNANGKITIELPNGESVYCQLGMNITVINSKKWANG